MNTPLVSILLPVYGVEDYIGECIDSVLEQDYPNLEIIFVDDCSPDGSSSIIKQRIPEIEQRGWIAKLIHNDVNKGSAISRNIGLDHAHGQYICFLDSDDLLPICAVSNSVKVALENDADIVRGDILRFSSKRNYPNEKRPPINMIDYRLACLDWGTIHLGVWGGIIKRDLFTKHHIRFYDGLNFGEDFGVTVRLAYYARTVAFVNEPVYKYRINASSMTKSYKECYAQDLIAISDYIKDFYQNKPDYSLYADAITRGRARIKTIMLLQLSPEVSPKYAKVFPDLQQARLPFKLRAKLWAMEHNFRTLYKIIHKIVD